MRYLICERSLTSVYYIQTVDRLKAIQSNLVQIKSRVKTLMEKLMTLEKLVGVKASC